MEKLYPIKFTPILKERVWGGDKLEKTLNKTANSTNPIGESWEISAVEDNYSIVENGFLKGNDIVDIVETYLGDIVGDQIYERYGNEFPILLKFLDIQKSLSLQVHPDDTTAIERHNSYGKTECWYIMDASPDAKIYLGFNKDITAREFYQRCKDDTITEVLNIITPQKGDFIFIEPQTLHAATGGVLIAEIQQVSDLTYRVYDWGREHDPKTAREMHLDLAIDCINYNRLELDSRVIIRANNLTAPEPTLIDCPHFKVKLINHNPVKKLINSHDFGSFVIYMCIEGEVEFVYDTQTYTIKTGESILIPAYMGEFTYTMKNSSGNKILEITGKA